MTTTTTEYGSGSTASVGVRVSDPAPSVVDDTPSVDGQGEGAEALGVSPDDYADMLSMAIRAEDSSRARGAQTDGGQLGASDAGQCERKAVWTVTQQTPTDLPKKGRAVSGTYLHEGILRAKQTLNPDLLIEHEMQVTLPSGVQIMVHPDEIDPAEPSVTDLKTTAGVAAFRKSGPSEQHRMQRAIYYYAALQNGIVTTDKGLVRNLYVNPADLDDVFVQQEPFDIEWVHRADDWFARVIYAVKNLEDGEPQAPYNFCASYCPWFSRCRPPVPELAQEITSPDLRDLVLLGHQARSERKNWQEVEDHVVSEIRGLSGRVGDVQVVSTVVNGSQRSYTKVEFRQVAS